MHAYQRAGAFPVEVEVADVKALFGSRRANRAAVVEVKADKIRAPRRTPLEKAIPPELIEKAGIVGVRSGEVLTFLTERDLLASIYSACIVLFGIAQKQDTGDGRVPDDEETVSTRR